MALPEVGSTPPAFTLPSQNGNDVSLADYAGKNVLIWFFPRAFGGGWTKQIDGFRDRIQNFADKNTELVGITFNSPGDLKKWGADESYPGVLLSDGDRSVAMSYGAAESADQEKATRISILVGADGKVVRTYDSPVADEHPGEALSDLG
jgi:thioredoxin-dependent peroxiredoxin